MPQQLLELYKVAVEEYRFEVRLGWDRAMYYMIFNITLVSVATGLLKVGDSPLTDRFVACIFLFGLCTSLLGQKAIRKAHEYYRRTVVKKTLIEDMLGLTRHVSGYPSHHTLAIGSTAGQSEHVRILHEPETWVNRGLRTWSITYLLVSLLWLLAAMNLAGILVAIWLSFAPGKTVGASPPLLLPA